MIMFRTSLDLDGCYHHVFMDGQVVFRGGDALPYLESLDDAELVLLPMGQARQLLEYLARGADEPTIMEWELDEECISGIDVVVGATPWYYGSVFSLFESGALRTIKCSPKVTDMARD